MITKKMAFFACQFVALILVITVILISLAQFGIRIPIGGLAGTIVNTVSLSIDKEIHFSGDVHITLGEWISNVVEQTILYKKRRNNSTRRARLVMVRLEKPGNQ